MKIALVVFFILAVAQPAIGSSVSYFFSSGNRSATVDFAESGSTLLVTLTNTSTSDALVPTDILTAVFFELDGDPALTRVSAMLPASASVFVGNSGTNVTPADRVVGGEWSYVNSVTNPVDHNQGVSSTGLGIFGPGNRFPGANLQGPTSPAGVQYGITSAGDDLLTGNGGLSGEHLIKNSVVFTLNGFDGDASESITAVRFLYGTSLDEPQFEGTKLAPVPEPGGIALGALALCGLLSVRRRWWRAARV